MNYLERNYHLIKERMIEQMEKSIILGRKLIDSELELGIISFIVKPLVKLFYDNWAKNDVRDNTMKQINLTLDTGLALLKDGTTEDNFNRIMNENLPKYIEADQTSLQCTKQHKNYKKIVQLAEETFANYLKEVVKLLEVKDNVENYGDLCRVAFKSKEIAEENLRRQLNFTERGIKVVEEDSSILKIPIARRIIVKTLRKGFEQTKNDFIKALNDTYKEK